MEMAAITHRGKVRENNEDAYYLDTEQGKLFAIADGMGGHNAGEVASQIAIEKLMEVFKSPKFNSDDAISAIRQSFEAANSQIDLKSKESEAFEGMGTTLTLAYVDEPIVYVGHIGDSRAYLINGCGIKAITKDHTLVSELVRNGTITEEEAKHHPQRNVIMKALGSGCKSTPDIYEVEIEEESIIVICSDGLTDLVHDEEIESSFKRNSSLVESLKELKDIALSRGGHDNITIVAASIKSVNEVK